MDPDEMFDYGQGKTRFQETHDSMAMLAVSLLLGLAVLVVVGVVIAVIVI